MGRVWRHPQKKTVIHYSIIADNTSDVFIASLGSEKGLMHRRFMGQSTALGKSIRSRPPTTLNADLHIHRAGYADPGGEGCKRCGGRGG